MVSTAGAAVKRRSGINRTDRDEFQLCASQCFLGPKEFELKKTEFSPVTFGYGKEVDEDDEQFWGVVQFETANFIYRTIISQIERITIVPPSVTQTDSTILVCWLSKVARIRLRKTMDISRETVERAFPLIHTNHSDAFRYLIFVAKPWNPINAAHVIRTTAPRTRKQNFHQYGELKNRLNNWLVRIRTEDIEIKKIAPSTVTKHPFIKELSAAEWLDFTKLLNLKISNSSRFPGLTELRYFRPGQQTPAAPTPKSRPVEVYSMLASSEKAPNQEDILAEKQQNGEVKKTAKRSSSDRIVVPGKKTKKAVVTIDETIEDPAKSAHSKQKPGTSCQNLLNYGVGHHKISLSFGDISKLAPEQLLNDNIVEFYLRFLQLEHSKPNTKNDVYIFSTFLFSRLVQQPTKTAVQLTKRGVDARRNWVKKNYEAVKKWTRNVDIFSKKLLIIPVNYEEHWYLIIVRNPGNCLRQKGETKSDKTLIYVFNSLIMEKCQVTRIAANVIKDYLVLEFNDKKLEEIGGTIVEADIQNVTLTNVSGQMNLVDCGLYVLGYTEIFLMWQPKSESTQLNFNNWWPLFQTAVMTRMRYKVLSVIRKKSKLEAWNNLKLFESRKPTEFKSTEERLEKELQSRGLRRWQSETDIRPNSYRRYKKRAKSLDRVIHDDQFDRTFDNFEQQ